MRKLNQILALVAVLMLAANAANAQLPIPLLPKALVYGNVTYISPQTDTFKNNYYGGVGLEVGAGAGLGSTLLYGSVGIQRFASKGNNLTQTYTYSGVTANIPYKLSNLIIVPIKVGVRKYFLGKVFANAAAGVAIQSFSGSTSLSLPSLPTSKSFSVSNFTYELGAGVKVSKFIELGAAYSGFRGDDGTTVSTILLKAGFALKI